MQSVARLTVSPFNLDLEQTPKIIYQGLVVGFSPKKALI